MIRNINNERNYIVNILIIEENAERRETINKTSENLEEGKRGKGNADRNDGLCGEERTRRKGEGGKRGERRMKAKIKTMKGQDDGKEKRTRKAR
jgi:hypothetical protein